MSQCHDIIGKNFPTASTKPCRFCHGTGRDIVAHRTIVRLINGRRCVPAWPHEPDAFEFDGEFYRALREDGT